MIMTRETAPHSATNVTVHLVSPDGTKEYKSYWQSFRMNPTVETASTMPLGGVTYDEIKGARTGTGTISGGFIGLEFIKDWKKLVWDELCSPMANFTMTVEFCFPSTGETHYIILKGVSITSPSIDIPENGAVTQSVDFKFKDWDAV